MTTAAARTSSIAGDVERVLDAVSLTFLVFAPLWDAAGYARLLPPWWPPVSYVMIGFGIATASFAVLVRTLRRRHTQPHRAGAGGIESSGDDAHSDATRGVAYVTARGTALELVAIGVFLGAWMLRGHAEIPPDPPLITAQLFALVGMLIAALRRGRAPR